MVSGCSDKEDSAPEADTSAHATATVERKDLVDTSTKGGSLTYADTQDLSPRASGTITQLAAVGKVIENGDLLYRIDTRPTVRLDGKVPAWRALGSGVSDGKDVLQLEKALHDLGYADDLTVDDHWTSGTTAAVKAWQRHLGVKATGSLALGDVEFTPGDLRVTAAKAHLGAAVQPGTAVLQVTGGDRIVTVSLDPGKQAMAPVGGAVRVTFPDGSGADGRIATVSSVPADPSQPDSKASIEVEVKLPAKSVAQQLDGASVQVAFAQTLAEKVLTVPVTALVALSGGGYGVQKVGPSGKATYVAVTPGTFAATEVAIESEDLHEGDKVVVTP